MRQFLRRRRRRGSHRLVGVWWKEAGLSLSFDLVEAIHAAVVLLVPVLGCLFDLVLVTCRSKLRGTGQEPDAVHQVLGILLYVSIAKVVGCQQAGSGLRLCGIRIGLQFCGISFNRGL